MTPKEIFDSLTFTQRREVLRTISTTGKHGYRLDKEELEFFTLTVNTHHRNHTDTIFYGCVIIDSDKKGTYNYFASFNRDGIRVKEVVGVTGALNAKKKSVREIKHQSLLNAMRECLIAPHNVIRKSLLEKNPYCSICNCKVDISNSHLDHCGKYEFKEIAERYFTSLDHEIEIIKGGDFQSFTFAIQEQKDEWLDFHNALAKLQLTCITCNLKK